MHHVSPDEHSFPRHTLHARRSLLSAVTVVGVLAQFAGATDRSWIGPATGNWHTGANWTDGVVPNANPPADVVFIDGGRLLDTDVTLDFSATILGLSISSGDALTFAANQALNVGTGAQATLNNGGTIRMLPSFNALTLRADDNTISGGGTLQLSNSARLRTETIGGRITCNNLIEGDGFISGAAFTNTSTIRANNPGLTLTVELTELANTGTVVATNGGILLLAGGHVPTWTNTGGTIRADDGSEVRFSDGPGGTPRVIGGTLITHGTGVLRNQRTLRLRDVTNSGNFTGDEASSTIIEDSFTNNGSANLNAAGFAASLGFGAGTFELTGGGQINLNSLNSASNAHVLTSPGTGSATLVNVDNTIRGQGSITGSGTSTLINGPLGVIDADAAGRTLTVNPSSNGGMFNHGVMRATNGGTLLLSGHLDGAFTNTGTIAALDGSEVQLQSNPTITGGTLATAGSGVIRNNSQNATLTDLTLAGQFIGEDVSTGGGTNIAGTITNLGSINLNSTDLVTVAGPAVTLTGGGVVNLDGTSPRILGAATLLNVNNTIQGAGLIGGLPVVNQGTIAASGGTLTISPSTGNFVNSGTLRATAGGTVVLPGSGGGGSFISTDGAIDVQSGGTITLRDSALLDAGLVTLNGTWNHGTSSMATVTHIRGNGHLNVTHGRVTVRAGGGTIGTSRVGGLSVTGGGQLDLTDHDLVIDHDGVSPIQTIRQRLLSGYAGGAWDGAGIITTSGTGNGLGIGYAEASAIFEAFPASFSGQLVDDSSVLLRFTRFGDANLNGAVNLQDFNRLAANFGASNAVWSQGDFNYDGNVNLQDFNLLAANFGQSAGPDGAVDPHDWANLAAAVPEPTAPMAAGALGLGMLLRRRMRLKRCAG
jgi:hypothetical protein